MESAASKSRLHDGPCLRLFFFFEVLLLAAIYSCGCAGKDFNALQPGLETRGHYIKNVPFYRQTESTCGPAALASVLAFWGRPAAIEQITSSVYLPELRGTLPMDMESFAREKGFEATSSNGDLEDLKAHLRKDVPVICLLDLGFGPYRRPHYITAIGFDDTHAVIIEHDGLRSDRLIGYESFNKAWTRAGNWMLVIRPKEVEIRHEP
jgi:ABC-type bacteriocin/lantibiotic exporter with double-glycine peptidase domain